MKYEPSVNRRLKVRRELELRGFTLKAAPGGGYLITDSLDNFTVAGPMDIDDVETWLRGDER